MRYFLAVFVALCGGCSTAPLERVTGPSYADEERAYRITWEQTFGMERESRPPTVWLDECANPEPRTECIIADLSPDGEVSIVWREGRQGAPRITGTPWVHMLAAWREVLLTGRRGEPDGELVKAAREALGRVGL
jgi:hypothetical protein